MPYPIVGVFLGFGLTLAWFSVLMLIDVYQEIGSAEVVTCPANGLLTAVRLRPAGDQGLPRITRCSRRPMHRTCDQACVRQVPRLGAG